MSTLSSKDRASLCTFTFADGRRCRTPRQSGHPQFCCFHARKQGQLEATGQLGRDFTFLLSGEYFSACDLAAALGRLFAAVVRGDVKPRAAATLAYLAQTLNQTIQAAQHEYINAFGTDVGATSCITSSSKTRNTWLTALPKTWLNPRLNRRQPPKPKTAPNPHHRLPCHTRSILNPRRLCRVAGTLRPHLPPHPLPHHHQRL
jgi:hypothetical protein